MFLCQYSLTKMKAKQLSFINISSFCPYIGQSSICYALCTVMSVDTQEPEDWQLKNVKCYIGSRVLLAPELKSRVCYSDHLSFIIHLWVDFSHFHLLLYLKISFRFSRTTGAISTKLSTKHSLVKGIQVGSNERPSLFSKRDDNKFYPYIVIGPQFLYL